jgi:type II secretory pathway component GspD/PulD (secretin)
MSGPSCVLLVTFPEHPDVRARSIVVRQEGSTSAELVSKIMAKAGLTGVGFATLLCGGEERTLGPKEDVYAIATQEGKSPKDIVLALRTANALEKPPSRSLPTRGGEVAGVAETIDSVAASERLLAERVAEQEKLIMQLKQIEKEQKKIIDAQARQHAGGGSSNFRSVADKPLNTALEVDKLQMALDEERRQNLYHKQELDKMKQRTAEYARRMKEAGVEPPLPPPPRGQ